MLIKKREVSFTGGCGGKMPPQQPTGLRRYGESFIISG